MLAAAPPTPRRDRIAIGASIAVHLCALAALVVTYRAPSFPVDDPDERVLLTSIIRLEHRPPPTVVPQQPVARNAPQRAVPAPVIHAAVTVEHATRKLVVASEHRAGFAPAPVSVRRREAHVDAAPAPAIVHPATAPVAEAGATNGPVASPAPSPVAAQRDEGIGNFGETYPASIEPGARSVLLAGVNAVSVRVTVDENGRAIAVEFLRGPADAGQRDELRTRLLAAHFIPAACNGLRCAGILELRN